MTYSHESRDPMESMKLLSSEEVMDILEAAGMEVSTVAPPGFGNKLRRFGRMFKEVGGVLADTLFRNMLKFFVLLGAVEVGLLGILRLLADAGIARSLVAILFHLIGLYIVSTVGFLLSLFVLYLPLFGGMKIFLGARPFTLFLGVGRIMLLLVLLVSPAVFFMSLPWHTNGFVNKLYSFVILLGIVLSGLQCVQLSKSWERGS